MGDKMTSGPEHVGPSGGEGVLGTFKNILILADSSVVTEWLAAYLAKAFEGAQYHVLGVADPLIKHFARIPMSEAEMGNLLARTKAAGSDGRHERFKTSRDFDAAYHRRQHGL